MPSRAELSRATATTAACGCHACSVGQERASRETRLPLECVSLTAASGGRGSTASFGCEPTCKFAVHLQVQGRALLQQGLPGGSLAIAQARMQSAATSPAAAAAAARGDAADRCKPPPLSGCGSAVCCCGGGVWCWAVLQLSVCGVNSAET